MTSVISASALGISFEGRRILQGLSLDVGSGELVAIMGPSGSGKTTLLAILGGVLHPDEGGVLLEGRPVLMGQRGLEARRQIAWVFQTTNVAARRSVIDNVAMGLLAHGYDRAIAEDAAGRALKQVGLAGFERRLAVELSGGERQRLCIARATATRPALLLADEPTGQLDASTSELVMRAMRHSLHGSTSGIVVTHDPKVAHHCDTVYQLTNGVLNRVHA